MAVEDNNTLHEENQDKRIALLERRLAKLEEQQKLTNSAFEQLVAQIKPLQDNLTRGIMGALSGVFHNLSDSLAVLSQPEQRTGYFEVTPVPEGTPKSILVKLTDGRYDFTTSDEPDKVMNEGTEPLVDIIIAKGLLKEGQTGWFHITQHEVQNGTSPAEAN